MKFSLILALVFLAATLATAADKPRVFITCSKSWETSGGAGGTSDGFGGASKGGARPQTAEIIKTFNDRCPAVIINNKQEKADYIVLLDHEGGKEVTSRDNKFVVFNKDGDSIASNSTRILGNAVKDACTVITEDWSKQMNKASNAATPRADTATPAVASKEQ